ncbi:threonine/serine exporter family protein [Parabacteroides sp. Marseille-P3160]|uniref:threonine/serine exporter family protein n=1 Tax=Parabacteroides sp. Marseille-P3160 TaxID=1917887 RepID=UPI0009BAF3B7|nr:threonine/serine exporter family protein [Parabacteroides sp. Marseille-P3160]
MTIFQILSDVFFAFFVAVGFAMIFETPKRALPIAGILGGIGHCIRSLMVVYGCELVPSTFCGAVTIGILGIFCAHLIHTPPVVFTLPACITMIPGLYAYRTILGLIQIFNEGPDVEQSHSLHETAYNFILTSSLLFCLAIGICIAMLLFRKKSVKNMRFKQLKGIKKFRLKLF